jgi:hypothetical protein
MGVGETKIKASSKDFISFIVNHYQADENCPSAVLPSSLVITAYFCVRLIPRNKGALHLNIFHRPVKKIFFIITIK